MRWEFRSDPYILHEIIRNINLSFTRIKESKKMDILFNHKMELRNQKNGQNCPFYFITIEIKIKKEWN